VHGARGREKEPIMKVGQQLDEARRAVFVEAALRTTDEGIESRVKPEAVRAAVQKALKDGDLKLRTFSSGSVGAQLPIKVTVANEEGQEFDLRGQILLTIPETVIKKS
jgi:hypothetical protein